MFAIRALFLDSFVKQEMDFCDLQDCLFFVELILMILNIFVKFYISSFHITTIQ